MLEEFHKPGSEEDIARERIITDKKLISVRSLIDKTGNISAELAAQEEGVAHINLVYYPAWKFFLNGENIDHRITPNGYDISIPAGLHSLDIKFEQTITQKIANAISLTGIMIMTVGIIISRRKRLSV